MKLDNQNYLEQTLKSQKMRLEELNVVHRINISTYEARKELITRQIESIERQLDSQAQ